MLRKMFLLVTLLFFIILIPNLAKAESSNVDNETIQMQIEHYKELYENQKDYNERILSTVYWSIGAMAVFAVLFVGANFIYNAKINEKELDSKTESIRSSLIEKHSKEINELFEASKKDFTSYTDTKLKSHIMKTEGRVKGLEYDLKEIDKEIISLKGDLANQKAIYWREKGVHRNELAQLIKSINYYIEANETILHPLNKLNDLLKKVDIDSIYVTDKEDLYELSTNLPEKHSIYRETITNYLKEIG